MPHPNMHTASASNRGYLVRARDEIAAKLARLTANVTTEDQEFIGKVIGWGPAGNSSMQHDRNVQVMQACQRITPRLREIANTQADLDAANALLAAFDSHFED